MSTDLHLATKVEAIIVAHNSGELLLQAVESVLRDIPAESVHVIDGESTDGSIERLTHDVPGIRVHPVENFGFAAGNNVGIAATSAPFVLLLNPDAELEPGAVAALLEYAHSNPEVGIVGGLVLDPDGGVQDGAWGHDPSLTSAFALRVRRLIRSFGGPPVMRPPAQASDVDWLTGACMLVRRAAIAEVGDMDEGFFLYFEDLDWCRRMRVGGWRVVLQPAARIVHRSGSSGGGSARGQAAYRKSSWRYCDKYGLRVYAMVARIGLVIRGALGGRK